MKKVGGIIVTHGQVANELLAAAETVVGELSHITAVSIGWHDDVEVAKDEIARAIKSVSSGAGVLILTAGFWAALTGPRARNVRTEQLEQRKEKLFADLVALEDDHRQH
ncbi:MAG: PTS sugar transporter subunit IIA, partial [Pyrinomonadaceae bacterium]